ncbi:hypothetical protein Saso_55630 [Streptomyces asoensis]|uniref:Uncharacterized protein n=1 Tax=Streptomyces asoensis TaxID=249586 RepID=A0ABQ3S708_9ACTN|nr:hypothetical protein GCM10010496_46010 [Streptomyces asoensis]GHI63913.1 hypothetical protein Saso_55630 [Streptomyces asoensis]
MARPVPDPAAAPAGRTTSAGAGRPCRAGPGDGRRPHGHRRPVPGARGCVVFRNGPGRVAGAFWPMPGPGGRFERTFAHVVSGVPDRTPGVVVLGASGRALGRQGPQVQP